VAFGTVSLDRGKTVRVDVSQDLLAKIGDTPPKTKAKQLADRPGFSDYKTMLDGPPIRRLPQTGLCAAIPQ